MGLGRKALDEEITAWDLDIAPDGTGLPIGSGSVSYGEEIFSEQCGACHGISQKVWIDGQSWLAERVLLQTMIPKTVGSYWPYLSTAWDYIHRSMPFGYAQSLSDDDVCDACLHSLFERYHR